MKTILLITLSFLFLATSCSSPEESSPVDYPLGIFSFDIDRLAEDEAAQIAAVRSIGYTGLIARVRFEDQFEQLKRYQAIIGDAPFEIYGGYLSVIFDAKLDEQNAHIDNIIQVLKQSGGSLCVILYSKNPEQKRAEATAFLRSAAERTKAAGIELVIFPHVGERYLVKSAEEALPYIEEIQSDNIFVALHLSHEVMAGNKDRLDEVAEKMKPWIRLPSINGTDVALADGPKKLERGVHIKPLGVGDYDASQLLKALKSVDYEGPVILHNWGLADARVDHVRTSFARFQEMMEEL
jgi:sugar phosphate isomerase/epimerase